METLYTSQVHGFPNLSSSYYSVTGEEGVLSLVVVLATSVSLVALVFAFITYSLFSDLRTLSGTTLMTMLASMFMSQLIYVVGVGGVQDRELCLSISFSLEYLDLGTACWLSALCYECWSSACRLQAAPVSEMCLRFAKTSVLAWGCPGLALAAAFYLQPTQDLTHLYKLNCWFLDRDVYLVTYLLPGATLLVADAVLLVRARVRLEYLTSLEPELKVRLRLKRRLLVRLKLFSKFLVVAGLVVALSAAVRLAPAPFPLWIAFNAARSAQGALVAVFSACHSKALGPSRSRSRFPPKSASLQVLTWTPIPDTV